MPTETPTARTSQGSHREDPFSDDSSSDDEFPDILSEKFKELCQRRNQERIEMEAAEASEAVGAMIATCLTKAARPNNIELARDEPRRSPRIKAALRNSKQKAVQGVRRSARIAARTGRSS